MTLIDVVVIVATVLASAGLLWFFFGARTAARRAETTGLTQQVTVVVRGGYSPQRIEAVAGVPLQITFDRQESGDGTSRVVFGDLSLSGSLPAFEKTIVEITPDHAGQLDSSCGMNMIHGSLTVTPAVGEQPAPTAAISAVGGADPAAAAADEAREAQARQGEIGDLTRRVTLSGSVASSGARTVVAGSG